MIIKGRTYRVDSMLDLYVHVLTINDIGPDYFLLTVCYPYKRNKWIIEDKEIYKLSFLDAKKWKLLS
jgi:ferredoxin-fold anticodon binding domain-containing protein